ncbi:MAG: hypothetical protein DMD91_20700 [Candidatus Rokuibacteriota bacterium]|nr:MAG: hypothetical protein DMD91_20700 [Candidatus Rokubacteria bacterium]
MRHVTPWVRALRRLIMVGMLVIAASLAVAESGAADPYILIDLGTLGGSFSEARGINRVGQVVGYSTTVDGFQHAFVWDPAIGLRDLGTLPGGLQSIAHAINDGGQVAGQADVVGYSRAVRWDPVVGIWDLGTLGGSFSIAQGINSVGQVVGRASTTSGSVHAFLWDPINGIRDLGSLDGGFSAAFAINDAGQIAGVSSGWAGLHAVLWDASGGVRDLGVLPNAASQFALATGINGMGDIVGATSTAAGTAHAFRWNAGVMEDLGTLGGDATQFDSFFWSSVDFGSGAFAVNDSGQIVGGAARTDGRVHAFVWQSGFMQHLGTLGGATSLANAINAAGQIVGSSSTVNGESHAVLWQASLNTPVGSAVVVDLDGGATQPGGVRVQFASVSITGVTSVGTSPTAPSPAGFQLGTAPTFYGIATTASVTTPIDVCINYVGRTVPTPESGLRLLHDEGGVWVDVTTSLDTGAKVICGRTSSLSLFVIATPAPLISATIDVSPAKWSARMTQQVTALIGNLAGHVVTEIEVDSIRLNGTAPVIGSAVTVNSRKLFTGLALQVQFDKRAAFQSLGPVQPGQTATVTITGRLTNGMRFEGRATVSIAR